MRSAAMVPNEVAANMASSSHTPKTTFCILNVMFGSFFLLAERSTRRTGRLRNMTHCLSNKLKLGHNFR
jgi:hypothetical protein